MRTVGIKSAPAGLVPYDKDLTSLWTQQAKDQPRKGDRFHEMYSYWATVDAVSDTHVWWHDSVTGNPQRLTRAEWREKHAYGTIPGYSVMLHTRGHV